MGGTVRLRWAGHGKAKLGRRWPSGMRTTRPGRSTPPAGAVQLRTLRTHRRPSVKRPGAPCHGPDSTERPTRSPHARVDMTLPPAPSAGTTLRGRGTRDVLSYGYATSLASSHTGYSTTKVAAQQDYWRSGGELALYIPIPLRRWSAAMAPDGDSPVFLLVSLGVEPPRRNRTGDPIPTMEPPGTAVRTAVSPGPARP